MTEAAKLAARSSEERPAPLHDDAAPLEKHHRDWNAGKYHSSFVAKHERYGNGPAYEKYRKRLKMQRSESPTPTTP